VIRDLALRHETREVAPRMPRQRPTSAPSPAGGFFGTGLPEWIVALVLAFSVVVFLLWDGPLWRAPREASHVLRIGISYAIVIPLLIAALLARRTFSLGHLLGGTALVWSAKLLITSSLYLALASGSSARYAPIANWGGAPAAHPSRAGTKYAPAKRDFDGVSIRGRVMHGAAPIEGAIVHLDAPGEGRTLDAGTDRRIVIEGSRYDRSAYVATAKDRLLVENTDSALHTLRFLREGRVVENVPLPAGVGAHPVARPAPGLYAISCESHLRERALILIVDHPYFATTGPDGRFEISGVPAGATASLRTIVAPGVIDERTIEPRPNREIEIDVETSRAERDEREEME
jgi:hypothetical protein